MKKYIILGICLFLSFSLIGQNNKVQTAYSQLSYFQENKKDNLEALIKAKDAIELACEHEKTIGASKTWLYAGQIYNELSAVEDPQLSEGAVDKAFNSFAKVIDLEKDEKRKRYTNDALNNLKFLTPNMYNSGFEKYSAKDFKGAYGLFSKVLKINEITNSMSKKKGEVKIDTSTIFAAAASADKGGMKDEAIKYYNQLMDLKYDDPSVFQSLAKIYRDKGEAGKADEVLAKGREMFPDNSALLIDEINRLLNEGKMDQATEKVKEAIELSPDNASLYALLGSSYLNRQDYAVAEEMFQKAIEKDENYADAYYNLGVVFYNQGADISKKAADLPIGDASYDGMLKSSEELLGKSVPMFEKFLTLKPGDMSTMRILKETYLRLKMNDKYEAINKAMEDGTDYRPSGTSTKGTSTCGAVTQDGTSCKNPVKGGGRCHHHK